MRYRFLANEFHQLKYIQEDCLYNTKNISLEITKTVEPKNLVAKKVWSPVNPRYKNMTQVYKTTFKQIVFVLLQCF